MARVARLAGALLAETNGSYYLIGNTKRPCDFAAMGFLAPLRIDALSTPFIPLTALHDIQLETPWLLLDVEGEALPKLLYERFVITRNGSVSDRLWRLVAGLREEDGQEEHGQDDGHQATQAPAIDARWLGGMPAAVWDVVRDSVLRCT